jgi:flavin reductase (DIM6/NTAB) family NADH-FMN oxidoreductase RutF
MIQPYRCLYPRLTVLVTTGTPEKPNAIAVAWNSPLSADPPLVGVSISPSRHSHALLRKQRDFVLSVPSADLADKVLYIGSHSGKNENKLEKCDLTPARAEIVTAPLISECPINLECTLWDEIQVGDHSLFIGQVVKTHVRDRSMLDDWGPRPETLNPVYWRNSRKMDFFTLERSKSQRTG